jgi:hypothetical protein
LAKASKSTTGKRTKNGASNEGSDDGNPNGEDKGEGDADEGEGDADKGDDEDKSVWGKNWNRRTVAGYLYKDDVQREIERLIQEGHTNLSAYQPALTEVYQGLTEKEKRACARQAELWNKSIRPRDIQIEYVVNFFHFS